MTNAELLLRSILGPIRSDIRPLALAVDITDDLLFLRHVSMDDILVTKQVYPDVAKLIHRKPDAVSRRIERLAHLCWDAMEEQNLVAHYLGRPVKHAPAPCDLIVYLAVYSHLRVPFFLAIEQDTSLLFSSTPTTQLRSIPLDEATANALLRSQPLLVTQIMVYPASAHPSGFPVCPHCLATMEREYQNYCDRCGQCLDWSQFKNAQIIYPDQRMLHA